MNQNKREALSELLPLLKSLQAELKAYQEEEAAKERDLSKINSVIYAPLLPLVYGKKLKAKTNWENSIKDYKIIRAAKNLIVSCNDDIINVFITLNDQVLESISAINPKSTLIPKLSLLKKSTETPWSNAEKFAIGIYENYLSDIFNQGRLHQTLYNKNINLKKIATLTIDDASAADRKQAEILKIFNDDLKKRVNNFNTVLQEAVSLSPDRNNLEERVGNYIIGSCDIFKDLMHDQMLEAYSAGNLYQIKKDNTEWVYWQTGQHANDCGDCRASQMGDVLLKTKENEILPHSRLDSGLVLYNLKDILNETAKYGSRFFHHHRCRCNFLPYHKK